MAGSATEMNRSQARLHLILVKRQGKERKGKERNRKGKGKERKRPKQEKTSTQEAVNDRRELDLKLDHAITVCQPFAAGGSARTSQRKKRRGQAVGFLVNAEFHGGPSAIHLGKGQRWRD